MSVSKQEFHDTMLDYKIQVHSEDVEIIWQVVDLAGVGRLDYYTLMRAYFGEMSRPRYAVFLALVRKLDTHKSGYVHVNDVYKYYRAQKHPKVRDGQLTEADMFAKFLSSFELIDAQQVDITNSYNYNNNNYRSISNNNNSSSNKTLLIAYEQLEEYYNGLSICVDSDTDFMQILRNSWNV